MRYQPIVTQFRGRPFCPGVPLSLNIERTDLRRRIDQTRFWGSLVISILGPSLSFSLSTTRLFHLMCRLPASDLLHVEKVRGRETETAPGYDYMTRSSRL